MGVLTTGLETQDFFDFARLVLLNNLDHGHYSLYNLLRGIMFSAQIIELIEAPSNLGPSISLLSDQIGVLSLTKAQFKAFIDLIENTQRLHSVQGVQAVSIIG